MKLKSVIVIPAKNKRNLFSKVQAKNDKTKSKVEKQLQW